MKAAEVKEMTTQEITDMLTEERAQISKLEMAHTISPIENPMLIRDTRKNIARLETELRARQTSEA